MSRPFHDVMGEIDGGQLLDELTAAYAEITRAVMEVGSKGELNIKLSFKRNKHGQILLETEVKKSVPKVGIAATIFFANEEGSLSRRDPRQVEMFGDQPIRKITG